MKDMLNDTPAISSRLAYLSLIFSAIVWFLEAHNYQQYFVLIITGISATIFAQALYQDLTSTAPKQLFVLLGILGLWIGLALLPVHADDALLLPSYVLVACSFLSLNKHKAKYLVLSGTIIVLAGIYFAASIETSHVVWAATLWLISGLLFLQLNRIEMFLKNISDLRGSDPSTGCANRHTLETEMRRTSELNQRYSLPVTLLRIRLENYDDLIKRIGHKNMDKLCQEWVQVCITRIRNTDLLCRYNDNTFICILPNTKEQNALHLCVELENACTAYEYSCGEQLAMETKSAELHAEESTENWLNRAMNKTDVRPIS